MAQNDTLYTTSSQLNFIIQRRQWANPRSLFDIDYERRATDRYRLKS